MTEDQVNDWVRFPEFFPMVAHIMSERLLRSTLLKRNFNGATHFCKKPGGILFLSPSRFYEWIQKEGKT